MTVAYKSLSDCLYFSICLPAFHTDYSPKLITPASFNFTQKHNHRVWQHFLTDTTGKLLLRMLTINSRKHLSSSCCKP